MDPRIAELIERCKATAGSTEFIANAAKLAEMDCELEAYARDSRRRHSGIPAEHAARLDELRETAALDAARAWVEAHQRRDPPFHLAPPAFLLLGGDLGVGKSHAAAWCVDQLGGMFAGASEVAARKFDGEYEAQLVTARCLALDDFGAEPIDAGGWQESHLLRILGSRFAAQRPTVITTNLWGGELAARFGARLWDRISSSVSARLCEGTNLRHWSETQE